jgi:hypothetical protein
MDGVGATREALILLGKWDHRKRRRTERKKKKGLYDSYNSSDN